MEVFVETYFWKQISLFFFSRCREVSYQEFGGNMENLSEMKQSGFLPLGGDFPSQAFIEKSSILMCVLLGPCSVQSMFQLLFFKPYRRSLLGFDLEAAALIYIAESSHQPGTDT